MTINKEKGQISSFARFVHALCSNLLNVETVHLYSAKTAWFHGKRRTTHARKSVSATNKLNGGRCIDLLNRIWRNSNSNVRILGATKFIIIFKPSSIRRTAKLFYNLAHRVAVLVSSEKTWNSISKTSAAWPAKLVKIAKKKFTLTDQINPNTIASKLSNQI